MATGERWLLTALPRFGAAQAGNNDLWITRRSRRRGVKSDVAVRPDILACALPEGGARLRRDWRKFAKPQLDDAEFGGE